MHSRRSLISLFLFVFSLLFKTDSKRSENYLGHCPPRRGTKLVICPINPAAPFTFESRHRIATFLREPHEVDSVEIVSTIPDWMKTEEVSFLEILERVSPGMTDTMQQWLPQAT